MRYLKLYENFNQNDINNILEDIKWIMIEVSEYSKLMGSALDGDLVNYRLSNYNDDDLKVANKRLYDIGYTLLNYVVNDTCLIINKDLIDLSKFDNGVNDEDEIPFPVLDGVEFSNIQKELLLKHFEKTPNLHNIDTSIFMLSMEECYDYLSEFLGKDGILKVLYGLVGKKQHIGRPLGDYGGYDYDFTLKKIVFHNDGSFILNCYIHEDGRVLVMGEDEMNIIDAMWDDEIGWEIRMEMEDCIIIFLKKFVGDISDNATIEMKY
jgi:hypothetical protein